MFDEEACLHVAYKQMHNNLTDKTGSCIERFIAADYDQIKDRITT